MKTKLRILKVWTEHKPDESPDLSYLGEYSRERKSEHSIDRKARGGVWRNEFQYFTPAMTGDETGNPESPEQDYQRMEAYNQGDWQMLGVIAKCEVWNSETKLTQVIRSGGLWGVESDSGKDYFSDVERDELAGLTDELLALGFNQRTIKRAIKQANRREQ